MTQFELLKYGRQLMRDFFKARKKDANVLPRPYAQMYLAEHRAIQLESVQQLKKERLG